MTQIFGGVILLHEIDGTLHLVVDFTVKLHDLESCDQNTNLNTKLVYNQLYIYNIF